MVLRPYYWFSEFQWHEFDRRRWPAKIKPWGGPIKQAYIRVVGDSDVLDITSQADFYRIRTLNLNDVIGVATQGSSDTWTGQHTHPACSRSAVYVKGFYDTLGLVEAAIRQSYERLVAEEARIITSPTLQLERVLSGEKNQGESSIVWRRNH